MGSFSRIVNFSSDPFARIVNFSNAAVLPAPGEERHDVHASPNCTFYMFYTANKTQS